MPSEQSVYVGAFLAASAISFVVAAWVPRRYDARGTREFARFVGVVGVYGLVSATHVLLGASRTVTDAAVALELGLAATAAVLWLLFAAEYTNRTFHRRRSVGLVLAGFVALAFLLPATNPLTGFVYPTVSPHAEPFAHYEMAKGPGHYLITVVSYVPFLAGVWLLVKLLRSTRFLSRSVGALLVGVFALAAANALPYVAAVPVDYNPLYMPLGVTACGVATVVAIHYNLFAVTPVARQNVVTSLRDPLVTLDKTRRIVDVNPAFLEAFVDGRAGCEVAHRPFESVVPALADSVALEDHDGPQQVRIERPAAAHYTVTVSPVEAGPHLLGYTLVFRDVTEVVESRRELERQNEQLDEFAVSAAHNLRNPLGAIAGFTDVLESHLRGVGSADARYDSALVERCLSRLDAETDRMDDIIADFLRVMREGKTVRSVEPVDVEPAARSAIDSIGYDRLSLVVERPGRVLADPSRLELLLRAVFRSASDRAEGPVTVRVSVTRDGFVVEDDAGELPAEDCDMLLEHGRMSTYDVTGLGLVVARTLAQVHRWEVDAVPGDAGLRFVVTGAEALVEDATGPSPTTDSASSPLDSED
ncbi:MAG: histidine kinase N-terminal 7TM domain-containing protein [Haloarculaceae archaeon]